MKYDIEVYLGFYMIVMMFVGASNLMAIMLYWQLTRVKYMVNYGAQAAWKRLDDNIKKYVLDSPRCPGMARTGYYKVRGMMASMIPDPQAQAAAQQAGGGAGGIAGAMQSAMSSC